MSGSNQHTIPQIMLRGFGRKSKAKAIQVVVYRRDKIFTTGTRGVGAERFFYSPLGVDGETTLDDRVTTYEQQLDGYIDGLRSCAEETELDATKAAETITHLTVRTAQLRNSFRRGAELVVQGVAAHFLDPDKRWRALGYHLPKPTGEVKATIEKAYIDGGFRARGIPRKTFSKFMFDGMKANFKDKNQSDEIEAAVRALAEEMPKAADSGHRNALAKSLAPEERVNSLLKLKWRVQECSFDLLLPDCVAIEGDSPNNCRPLVFAPNKTVGRVFMPIASRRVLSGYCDDGTMPDSEALNAMLAKCSWDYFVAREKTPIFERLAAEIGSVIGGLLEEKIGGAVGAAFK